MRRKTKTRPPLAELFVSRSKGSRLHELRIASDIGGQRVHVPHSRTNLRNTKADAENDRFVVDGKQTDRKQFVLSEWILGKIDHEASEVGKLPVLAIEFTGMRFGIRRRWAVVPYEVFLEIARREEAK